MHHTRDDIARALIEGTLVEFRRCTAVLGDAGEVVISGGPSDSPFFRQSLASAVGATCAASPLGPYASAYGAGMLARTATGAFDEYVTARPQVVRTEPGDREIWNELAERHDALREAITGAGP
jgi:sugar (pentulose or hexulose) kinase